MITLTGTAPIDNSVSPLNSKSGAPAKSLSSFADQLATAIEQFLGNSKMESRIEIDLAAAPSQDSDVRQFTVSMKTAAIAATRATPAVPPTPGTSAIRTT